MLRLLMSDKLVSTIESLLAIFVAPSIGTFKDACNCEVLLKVSSQIRTAFKGFAAACIGAEWSRLRLRLVRRTANEVSTLTKREISQEKKKKLTPTHW
jgi:hypothetical protein